MIEATAPRRVLVAIDGSRPSWAALQWAVQRAQRHGVPLTLVHVEITDVDDGPHEIADPADAPVAHDLLEEAAVEAAALAPGLVTERLVMSGSLTSALRAAVGPEDLLVIGTNKIGFVQGRVIGSRSVLVAAQVAGDVAVIPDVDLRFRTGVVVGVDRDTTCRALARAAADESRFLRTDLLVLHAHPLTMRREPIDVVEPAIDAARAWVPELAVRGHIARQDPSVALLDAVRNKELLVLGPGSTSEHRAALGTVLHNVLLNTSTPVLIVRRVMERQSRCSVRAA